MASFLLAGGGRKLSDVPIDTPYEDLLRRARARGPPRRTAPAPARAASSAGRCGSTSPTGFPLVTTKRVHLKSIVYELLWFLRGDTNVRWLQEHGVTIWDEWADADGELGPVYGVQWRSGPRRGRAHRPDRRRRRDDAHQPGLAAHHRVRLERRRDPDMALPPCHAFFQFYVADGRLSCQLYQRSADLFLGVPFNIASYALLTHMVAQQAGLERRRLHLDRRRLPHLRQPRRAGPRAAAPRARAVPVAAAGARGTRSSTTTTRTSRSSATPHPAIKAPVAV